MGQIFWALAYDIEDREAVEMCADKFHANCYSYSGAVISMHYLLKKKPYRVMWLGDAMLDGYNLNEVSREEDLLGISITYNKDYYIENNPEWENQKYREKIEFIEENHSTWKEISVWDEAISELETQGRSTVNYEGYLINHTLKEAVDLANYFEQSKSHFLNKGRKSEIIAIDLIPVLTDMGSGSEMAYADGVPTNATENLASRWTGDLLEIVEALPEGYSMINCCFADVWKRAEYCRNTFGLNEDGLIIANKNGDLFEAVNFNLLGKRGVKNHIKVEIEKTDRGKKIKCIPVPFYAEHAQACVDNRESAEFDEGVDVGIKIGIDIGKEIAKNLLTMACDISKGAGLSTSEVEKFRSSIFKHSI